VGKNTQKDIEKRKEIQDKQSSKNTICRHRGKYAPHNESPQLTRWSFPHLSNRGQQSTNNCKNKNQTTTTTTTTTTH